MNTNTITYARLQKTYTAFKGPSADAAADLAVWLCGVVSALCLQVRGCVCLCACVLCTFDRARERMKERESVR